MSSDRVSVLVVEVAHHRLALLADAVDEVQPAALPTPLPGAPEVVEGLLDVRGEAVPVVEVRRRLGLLARPPELTDCLVLLRTGRNRLALRVDEAVSLADVERDQLLPHPAFAGAAYVSGTAAHAGDLLVVLDVTQFLTEGETRLLQDALAGGPDD
jgi:purine-binding chemotaxis protein CheW